MTQPVKDPPEQQIQRVSSPLNESRFRLTRVGIFSLLILIGLLMILFSGELVASLVQTIQHSRPASSVAGSPVITPGGTITAASPEPTATSSEITSIIVPDHADAPPLQLSDDKYVIYEQQNALYLVSSTGKYAQVVPTEGFISNIATPPILMPSGQILYSGDGLWVTDPFNGNPTQIATLDAGQVITSMALSTDGSAVAWSTEPANGDGMLVIYAGPMQSPAVVYQQSLSNCPCFHIFSFMNGTSAKADNTLLLSDDRGSQEAVQYGLWSLDLSATPADLQPILDENPQQGPLALMPLGNALLYSPREGVVPDPTDQSVPPDVAALSYANSLSITTLNGSPPAAGKTQVILPEQGNLSNSAQYHWVTTPLFSPDARTLAYVEFSSDTQEPYDRHSAIYTVQISGSGSHMQVSKPGLLATSTDQLVELGPWYDNHVLTFYADGALYAIDTQSGSLSTFAQTSSYAHIVAVLDSVSSPER